MTMPFGMIFGISVAKLGRYRPQLWFAWTFLIVGGVVLTLGLKIDTHFSRVFGFEVIIAVGLGILLTTAFFPVLAPLPPTLNANALAFFMFVRYFSQVCSYNFPVVFAALD